ncbi:SAM-dependent methyltransferase, partial [Agathobacter rectalis]
FEEKFPEAYKYLKSFYDKLNKRKSDEKAQWFEYGRSQAIAEIKGEKLIFPMVFTNKVKVYKCNSNAVPYAGYFLKKKDHSRYTLDDAKKILQSEKFYEYIKEHGTPTTATSYRMSTKEIENYLFEGI